MSPAQPHASRCWTLGSKSPCQQANTLPVCSRSGHSSLPWEACADWSCQHLGAALFWVFPSHWAWLGKSSQGWSAHVLGEGTWMPRCGPVCAQMHEDGPVQQHPCRHPAAPIGPRPRPLAVLLLPLHEPLRHAQSRAALPPLDWELLGAMATFTSSGVRILICPIIY